MAPSMFVVSGCASSELGLTARRLSALGAPCGHREVFRPEAFQGGRTLFWPRRVAGDASWFAAPVLGKLPQGAVVLHQVQHPLTTIGRLYGAGFFDSGLEDVHFVQDFVPETRLGGPLVRCMRFWLEWNRMVEGAADYDDLRYHRFRLEDLDETRLVELAAALTLPRTTSETRAVLQALAPEEGGESVELGWDDLPRGALRSEIEVASRRYGSAACGARRATAATPMPGARSA